MPMWSACTCEDEQGLEPWEVDETWEDETPDEVIEEPEPEPEPETIPPDLPWEADEVTEVERSQALTDRTALSVGEDGTTWIGFHDCADSSCRQAYLAAAVLRPGESDWTIERIAPQNSTFGLDVWGDTPWVAYLDSANREFRVAYRDESGWHPMALPVNYQGDFDGLDLTHDDRYMYVTFASNAGDPVNLFALDMTRPDRTDWIALSTLDVGRASAALERGLQADGQGNLFLVHRAGETGPYGVARYRLEENVWDQIGYLSGPEYTASSMIAREDGSVCISTSVDDGSFGSNGHLRLNCGTVTSLDRESWGFPQEGTSSYSSLIEGNDGSLITAYNTDGNTSLRVARRYPSGMWDFRTVFEQSSYGVSTGINKRNQLLISYYTCSGGRCTLELLSQPY